MFLFVFSSVVVHDHTLCISKMMQGWTQKESQHVRVSKLLSDLLKEWEKLDTGMVSQEVLQQQRTAKLVGELSFLIECVRK